MASTVPFKGSYMQEFNSILINLLSNSAVGTSIPLVQSSTADQLE